MRNIFFALFGLFFFTPAFAFGQVVVEQTTSYNGMTTSTTITVPEVATIKVMEDRISHGNCTIVYAEGDIPPHKMEAIGLVEGICKRYNRAQKVAVELSKEFNVTHYQALKVALESAFGWRQRYQRAPVDGLQVELKKIARKYLRAKKKAEKEAMKKRLITHALTSTTKEIN